MKKYFKNAFSLVLAAGIAASAFPAAASEYEDTEYFATDITLVKQSAYDNLEQNFTTISLKDYANNGYVDDVSGDNKGGWTDEGSGNDMSAFTLKGLTYFKNIPFDLVDPGQNGGKAVVGLAGRGATFIPDSAQVPIGKKAAGLYILHCSAWNYGTGDKKGEYTLVYDDGTSATVELFENINIHNFWGAEDYATCQNVWKANHPVGGQENAIGLFALSNPYPEKTIEKLYMHSEEGGTKSWLMVLGITLTDSGPYLPDMGIVDYDNPFTGNWLKQESDLKILPSSALDASNLTEKPAGKHGALTVQKDNFIFEDGTEVKFWGINLSEKNLTDHSRIDEIADDISKLGYNLARIKMSVTGISKKGADNIRYAVHKFRENGIYTYLALNDGGDLNGYFDKELIDGQKDGIEKLMKQKSEYTGIPLAEDSSVAMLEFMPGCGFYYYKPLVLSTVDEQSLKAMFNEYLKKKYGTDAKLKKVWSGDGVGLNEYESLSGGTVNLDKFSLSNLVYTKERTTDVRKFYEQVQLDYFDGMRAFVRNLGYKGLCTCNSNPLGEELVLGDSLLNSNTDFIARGAVHNYNKNGGDLSKPVYYGNNVISSLTDNGLGIIGNLSRLKYKDTPYVVSEWNSAWLGKNYTEDYLLMATYGARQNWNPIAYNYAGNEPTGGGKLESLYDIYNNPASRVSMVSAARLFDAVSKSAKTENEGITEQDIYLDGLRPYYMNIKDNKASKFIHEDKFKNFYEFALSYSKEKSKSGGSAVPQNAIYTDDEVKIDSIDGRIIVIADKAEAYAGQCADGDYADLESIALKMKNRWYTAMLTSVNNKPLKDESNMLLTLTASERNKGYSFTNNYINSPGRAPVIMQPVQGEVKIKIKGDFDIYSLDVNGERLARISSFKNSDGHTVFNVNDYSDSSIKGTIGFEIVKK